MSDAPTEIPEALKAKAREVSDSAIFSGCFETAAEIVLAFALQVRNEAIAEERRACAALALALQVDPDEDEQAGDDEWFCRTAANTRCRTIAAAIRARP